MTLMSDSRALYTIMMMIVPTDISPSSTDSTKPTVSACWIVFTLSNRETISPMWRLPK